jgi:hypothetical protein
LPKLRPVHRRALLVQGGRRLGRGFPRRRSGRRFGDGHAAVVADGRSFGDFGAAGGAGPAHRLSNLFVPVERFALFTSELPVSTYTILAQSVSKVSKMC